MDTEASNRTILQGLFGVDGALLLSPEQEYEARSPDYVMEMPQSGERIVGRGDLFVMEALSDYPGGGVFHVADIVEFSDGKIVRETRYYAEPFDPPKWRAAWVESWTS